jgi:hypothetical protein
MLFQCSSSMMSLGILARMALNLNFQNGATLSVLLNVQRVAAKHDPEHLASLETLMVIHNKGGNTWKDWVTNLLHQPDWKDRSIKTADVTKDTYASELGYIRVGAWILQDRHNYTQSIELVALHILHYN